MLGWLSRYLVSVVGRRGVGRVALIMGQRPSRRDVDLTSVVTGWKGCLLVTNADVIFYLCCLSGFPQTCKLS